MFSPGLILTTGVLGLWNSIRNYKWVISCLRGTNAVAVGLVFTAVFRLWETGYIDESHREGSELGKDPWWIVITTVSFAGGMWFKLPAPISIVSGAIMGTIWYAIAKA